MTGFANVTGRPEDAWLGTGLAETVSAGLAAVPGLAVVSRERILEVLRELGLSADADDPALAVRVGREVGAHGVVSGAYQSLGDRIRVTARVTETATGRVVLNPRVDGAREAIFELQDRLVAELVAGLRGQLPAARPEETQSLEAYEACSKGLLNFQEESQESIDRAIVFFERAAALDPGYARAHMLLGAALDLKGDYLTTPELSERALVSLDRALALRPDSAEAWRYRGSALITLNRDEEALAAFESALARNPMDASAQSGIARVHFILRGDFARAPRWPTSGPSPSTRGPAGAPSSSRTARRSSGTSRRPRRRPAARSSCSRPSSPGGRGWRSWGPTCASATPSPSRGGTGRPSRSTRARWSSCGASSTPCARASSSSCTSGSARRTSGSARTARAGPPSTSRSRPTSGGCAPGPTTP